VKTGISILLVEDNPGDARLIGEMLKESTAESVSITVARDMKETESCLSGQDFSIIILDLNLPDSKGIDTLRMICKFTDNKIPIIVLTGLNDEATGLSAIEYGAEDYIIKGETNSLHLLKSIRYSIERKKTKEALRESEERYRTLHSGMRDAFAQVDMEGHITDFNNVFVDMTGYWEDELKKMTYLDITPPRWHAFENRIIEETIIPRGFSDIYEKEYMRKDGKIFPVELRSILLYDSSGNPCGMWAIIRDITERKRNEKELTLHSTAMNNAANAIIITDKNGLIQYANPAFETLTGYAAHETSGKNPGVLVKSGRHEAAFYREMWEKILSGQIWIGELTNKRKDGTLYTEEMTIAPVRDSGGNITNFVAIKQDISEKQLAHDLLNTRLQLISYSENHLIRELLARTLDEIESYTSSSISFFHFVEDDQKTLSLQVWSGHTMREFCGNMTPGLHFDIDTAGIWADCVRKKAPVVHNDYQSEPHKKGLPEGHPPLAREIFIPVIRKDRIKAILGIGNKPVNYTDRDISIADYLAGIAWDIVEKKQAQENLIRLNLELESRIRERTADLEMANRELESFSYSVSHDLRAPLRHITGYLELLNEELAGLMKEKTLHYVNIINSSALLMGQLIDDLLSFSRMGRGEIRIQTINMRSLIDDVIMTFSEEIKKHNIKLRILNIDEAKGDAAMIKIVMMNLFSNGIKFTSKTPNAEIEIGSESDGNSVVFHVRDNGAGFDMRHADKLFGVFQRLHGEAEFEGTGIGLATVKRVIDRHGGRVWAEGSPGGGACFYFSLPKAENDDRIGTLDK
jgi:PAS domain S-box-containing protein